MKTTREQRRRRERQASLRAEREATLARMRLRARDLALERKLQKLVAGWEQVELIAREVLTASAPEA